MRLTSLDIKSSSRNPLVFGLFDRINMVEQVGSGINRIKDAVREAGLPEVAFKTKGMFTVIFSRPLQKTRAKTRVKTRVKILDEIRKNAFITKAELAQNMGVSLKGIEWHITNLKKENILKRIGPNRGGYWQIVEK